MSKELIERLRDSACLKFPAMTLEAANEIEQLRAQLAASQAREQQLLSMLTMLAEYHYNPFEPDNQDKWWHRIQAATNTPSDTTALEALIKKAGEVMRERCAVQAYEWDMAYVLADTAPIGNAEAIRALPVVTLSDIK